MPNRLKGVDMNYFKEAEQILYSVPKKEAAITQMTKRRERLTKKVAPRLQYAYESEGSERSDGQEILNDAAELAELIRSIDDATAELEEIHGAVDAIDDAQLRTLLSCWYFKRMTKEKIAEVLDVWSIGTVYVKRKKAIAWFAYLYWGRQIDEKIAKKVAKKS